MAELYTKCPECNMKQFFIKCPRSAEVAPLQISDAGVSFEHVSVGVGNIPGVSRGRWDSVEEFLKAAAEQKWEIFMADLPQLHVGLQPFVF